MIAMILSDSTFTLYGAKHYDNPHCQGVEEFEEDLKRMMYVRKLLNKYRNGGELKDRLILNHIVILHNCFGSALPHMIMFRCKGFESSLKPFLLKLSILPDIIRYDGKEIDTSTIASDDRVEQQLRNMV